MYPSTPHTEVKSNKKLNHRLYSSVDKTNDKITTQDTDNNNNHYFLIYFFPCSLSMSIPVSLGTIEWHIFIANRTEIMILAMVDECRI